MSRLLRSSLLCAVALVLAGEALASPLPVVTPRLPSADGDLKEGDSFWKISAEHRVRLLNINPLEVNGVVAEDVEWTEQRLRILGTVARVGVAAVHMEFDVLDGVLFGDNGSFGGTPSVTSGLGLASKQGNLSRWKVGLRPGEDPLLVDSYGLVLEEVEPVRVNFAYGEVRLPIGLLRVGRQPVAEIGEIYANDGRSGRNRWGTSFYHESADRLLFGTKLSEIFRYVAEGDAYRPDSRMDRGIILAFVYDHLVEDDASVGADDLRAFGTQLSLKMPELELLGPGWRDLELTVNTSYRWDERFSTSIIALPVRAGISYEALSLKASGILIDGTTRELSSGFAELTGGNVVDQSIEAMGARVSLEGRLGSVSLVGEWAYASGDDDPRPETPMSIFSWARDTNLGLVLFEHTLAFQSARAASVGIENLSQLSAPAFPFTELATETRVTNVNAFFPQVFWDVADGLQFKLGALFAWTDVPAIDPIGTIMEIDGNEVADDAINYNGGEPGNYWGTEIDVGVSWLYRDAFQTVIEAGVLFPGDALHDENGEAVPSWMIETRFTARL
ncbi:MAG: hypothetical protein CL940_05115 [Deltaproteobacteria bacterium]|nr:hypothetical protein [Deltaproteobacteria bacterium]